MALTIRLHFRNKLKVYENHKAFGTDNKMVLYLFIENSLFGDVKGVQKSINAARNNAIYPLTIERHLMSSLFYSMTSCKVVDRRFRQLPYNTIN